MKFVIVFLLFAFAVPLTAQVKLSVNAHQASVDHLRHYRTTDNQFRGMDHPEVFKDLDARDASSLGFDKANHWFSFQVENNSDTYDWLLEIGYSPLDHIEFYSQDENGNWALQFGGDHYPISKRTIRHHHVVFPFKVPSQTTRTFYLRVVTTSSIQVPLTIWSVQGLSDDNFATQFGHGVFYGIMLIMICYNLFLFLSIRDRSVLYYVLALAAGTNVIAFFQGYGFFYMYPEWPEINEIFSAFSAPLFIISSSAMTRSFLSLRQFSFALDRVLMAISVVALGAAFITLGFRGYVTYTPLHILAIIDFAAILVSAVYCFYRRYRPARYFLLAWATTLIVGVLFSFRNVGVIHSTWFVNNALYLGGIMQTLLISLALGDKINILQKENDEARERDRMRGLEEKQKLEREVLLRTEEIRLKNNQLSESNSVKDKVFSVLSHDIKGPLNSLKGLLAVAATGGLSSDELKLLTSRIGEQLHLTADFLDNLLQWSRLQMQGEQFRPQPVTFRVAEILRSATALLIPDFESKHLSLVNKVDEQLFAYADANMVKTVVRNLVSNAWKFTNAGGSVELSASTRGDLIYINVKDTGVGIAPRYLQTLFTLQSVTTAGTQEEKGTGIGLVVCKEFVERNGGEISVVSVEGTGTVFTFTLPIGVKG